MKHIKKIPLVLIVLLLIGCDMGDNKLDLMDHGGEGVYNNQNNWGIETELLVQETIVFDEAA